MRIVRFALACLTAAALVAGCVNAPPPSPTQPLRTATPTALPRVSASATRAPSATPTVVRAVTASAPATPTPDVRRKPEDWRAWPVIPVMTDRAREIYARGQELGRDAHAFSKVGDCASTPGWFLADFDRDPRWYALGAYDELQATIDYFDGSLERVSLAVKPGFTTASVLAPIWADAKQCESGESPLACEFRAHNPAFALIMLGSNNTPRPERFEPEMRKILDATIELGIVPVLATKADNLEGDHAINASIARLAYEYDIPLWNWWRAAQRLPNGGLQGDGAHLTWAAPRFDEAENMQSAWPWLNLTALQTLEALRVGVIR